MPQLQVHSRLDLINGQDLLENRDDDQLCEMVSRILTTLRFSKKAPLNIILNHRGGDQGALMANRLQCLVQIIHDLMIEQWVWW